MWAVWLIIGRMLMNLKGVLWGTMLHTSDLQLGRGSVVHGAKHIVLGKGIRARSGLWIEAITRYREQAFHPSLSIEDGVCFSDNVYISCIDRIVIKKNVLMGSRISISDHSHGIYKGEQQSLPSEPPARRKLGGGGPVLIGENVWVGDNVIIVGPVTIGDGAVLAANSVIHGDVPPATIVAGAPAKPIKRFEPLSGCWEPA